MYKTTKDLSSFAVDDLITRILLIERGLLESDNTIQYKSSSPEIASYVNYLLTTMDLMGLKSVKSKPKQEESKKLEKLFVKVHEYVGSQSIGVSQLSEEDFIAMFSAIKKGVKNGSDIELKQDQIEFLGECATVSDSRLSIDWSKFKDSEIYTKIPEMDCVYSRHNKDEVELELSDKNSKYLKKMLDEIRKDRHFTKHYRVNRVFKPQEIPNIVTEEMRHTWNKQTVLHGTSNFSILGILNSNFRLDMIAYGRSLGDGIYFARLEQSSKPLFYLDKDIREGSRYMFICNIYYKYYKEVNEYVKNNLNGKNMIWGKDLGAYSRDELVVLPQQIEIQYVLELSPKN